MKKIIFTMMILFFLSGCSGLNLEGFKDITRLGTITLEKPTDTQTMAFTQVSTKTSTSTITPEPMPTRDSTSTPFPIYDTKTVIFKFGVMGWHTNFDGAYVESIQPSIVLYSDGQMIFLTSSYQQKFLSENEIETFFSNLTSMGFFSLKTNQHQDETDPLFDFGDQYVRIYDGLYQCIYTFWDGEEKKICVKEDYKDFLIPEMKEILTYFDEYEPEGLSSFIPDRIVLRVEPGRNEFFKESFPEKAPQWPENLPSIETDGFEKFISFEGDQCPEIKALFDKNVKLFSENGHEYTVWKLYILPHIRLGEYN